jgi:hypothetical protein
VNVDEHQEESHQHCHPEKQEKTTFENIIVHSMTLIMKKCRQTLPYLPGMTSGLTRKLKKGRTIRKSYNVHWYCKELDKTEPSSFVTNLGKRGNHFRANL